jgi:hypothetical protein
MKAQNGPGSSARKRTIGLLALLAVVSSCECEQTTGTAACLANLRLNSSLALNNVFATDEWDVNAAFDGNAANCDLGSLGLNWTVSSNLRILQNLQTGVRLRAEAPGGAFVNAAGVPARPRR